MSSDPHENGAISVTLKEDGHNGMWTMFHGSPQRVREQLLEHFGLNPETYAEWTGHDLACEAQRLYKGIGNVSSTLGGKPVSDVHDDVADAKAAADSKEPENPLYGLVAGCDSQDQLKDLYRRNADEFKADKELLSAWKARGSELKKAAA